MKRLYVLILFILCIPFRVEAIDACSRTETNLYVPEKIEYKSSMKDDILNTPCVDVSKKVYDYADLFSYDEEINIYNEVNLFIDKTGLDMAIVSINYNNKEDAFSYAADFYDYNDFSYDGILFLIDMDTREYYVLTSGEAIFYFDDSRVDGILDYVYYDIVDGDYDEATFKFISKSMDYYNQGIITSKYTFDNDGNIVRKTPYLLFMIISFGVSLVVVLILKGRNKKVRISNDADKYLNNDFKLTNKEDKFIRKNTQRFYVPRSSSSSSSSSSGGFSIRSGSSGISHGGGGRKF